MVSTVPSVIKEMGRKMEMQTGQKRKVDSSCMQWQGWQLLARAFMYGLGSGCTAVHLHLSREGTESRLRERTDEKSGASDVNMWALVGTTRAGYSTSIPLFGSRSEFVLEVEHAIRARARPRDERNARRKSEGNKRICKLE